MRGSSAAAMAGTGQRRPRLAFMGLGWIGLNRMRGAVEAGTCDVAAIIEPSDEMRERALAVSPHATIVDDLSSLPETVEGVVIATPSALHAPQAIAALDAGLAVFCQKPLARTAQEARAVFDAARRADRLLGIDLSYRHSAAMCAVRDIVRSGELGRIFNAEFVFHNAYGPDKPWFYDVAQSGGGCLMDLGIHLLDLAAWTLGRDAPRDFRAALHAGGEQTRGGGAVEDHAALTFTMGDGADVRIACSWNLHAGQEADISAVFHGTNGAARFRNVGGSFYDFVAERMTGTAIETIFAGEDSWGERAIIDWARRLAKGGSYDPAIEDYLWSASVIDQAYGRS